MKPGRVDRDASRKFREAAVPRYVLCLTRWFRKAGAIVMGSTTLRRAAQQAAYQSGIDAIADESADNSALLLAAERDRRLRLLPWVTVGVVREKNRFGRSRWGLDIQFRRPTR